MDGGVNPLGMEQRLREVMPDESTIDLDEHARLIAAAVRLHNPDLATVVQERARSSARRQEAHD